jgi:hypothetical protein
MGRTSLYIWSLRSGGTLYAINNSKTTHKMPPLGHSND